MGNFTLLQFTIHHETDVTDFNSLSPGEVVVVSLEL